MTIRKEIPLGIGMLGESFFSKIEKTESCWFWTGAKKETGYGLYRVGKKVLSTHRLSFIHHKGEIPEGKEICHTCHVRECVNPDHLRLGTRGENMREVFLRRRQRNGRN